MKNLHEWGGPALINSRHYYRNPDPSPKNRRTGAVLVIGLISIIILMMIAASSSSQSSGSSARPDNSSLPISHIYIGPGTYNGFRFMSMTGSAHLALLASLIIFVSFWIPPREAKKEVGDK